MWGFSPAALVDCQRVGQSLRAGQLFGEALGQLPLLLFVQFLRQRTLDLHEQPPVGAFVFVGCGPIRSRIIRRPSRHIPTLPVFQFFGILLVLPFPLDVFRFGAGRLPAASASNIQIEVVDSHSYTAFTARHARFLEEKPLSVPSLLSGSDSERLRKLPTHVIIE